MTEALRRSRDRGAKVEVEVVRLRWLGIGTIGIVHFARETCPVDTGRSVRDDAARARRDAIETGITPTKIHLCHFRLCLALLAF